MPREENASEHVRLNFTVALGLLCLMAQRQTHAAIATPLALVASSTHAQTVVMCLSKHLSPLVEPAHLSTGLEARIELHAVADLAYFSVSLLLKPDVYSLLASLDEDVEAHPDLQLALLENLRHPIATQIYPWDKLQDCRVAAKWLSDMTRQAINLSPQKKH